MTSRVATRIIPPDRQRTKTVRAGVDLGTHSAKLVVRGGSEGAWRVVRAHCLPLPPSWHENPDELARTVGPWLQEHRELSCREVVLSIPSGLVDYESFDLPAGTEGDVSAAAREALQRLLGEDHERAAYDYWLGSFGQTAVSRIHLAWTSSEFAGQLSAQLTGNGWRCVALDAPAATLARLGWGAAFEKCPLVVDIGASEATFVWTSDGTLDYVRNRIRFSSESAPELLQRKLGLRAAAAEQLLACRGLLNIGLGHPIAKLVFRALSNWLQGLVFEIQRTQDYLRRCQHRCVVDQVVLCGGGACIRGLASWLAEQLGLSVLAAEIPRGWQWLAATPYSPRFALATALTNYGESP